MLSNYEEIKRQRQMINSADASMQLSQLALQIAMASKPSHLLGFDALFASPLAYIAGTNTAMQIDVKSAYNRQLIEAEKSAQVNSFWASFHRRLFHENK